MDVDELLEICDSEEYQSALESLTDEVFHILCNDFLFLRNFNRMVSDYIKSYLGFADLSDPRFTRRGRLKRVAIPAFVRDAIYHRDKGECRSCKKKIDRILSYNDKERYDHIIPLADGGPNDITNLQLLCERCNLAKSDKHTEVSNKYIRAYRNV